jgi:PAS domain S-box-containing protein
MLWGAFAGLSLLVATCVALTITVVQMEKRQEYRIIQLSRPLVAAVQTMETSLLTMISATRGYALSNGQSSYVQQYDDAARAWDTADAVATDAARSDRDRDTLNKFRAHFNEIRQLLEQALDAVRDGREADARALLDQVADKRRAAADFSGRITERQSVELNRAFEAAAGLRQWVVSLVLLLGLSMIAVAALAVWRIERSVSQSITRQVRRTEAMIAGMADGVMLVDGEGRTVFVNPSAQKLLGKTSIGVPIYKHSDIYGFRDEEGMAVDAKELPAAQALATGRPVEDVTMTIARAERKIAISMNATPLEEEGRISGAVVTFRDVTERRRLEEKMQAQAESAQILADAGAFFSSNIDPVWVTQAIAERVAEVLGDWAAVILKTDNSLEMRVASIHHRDMASLGMAWSYIYRQPLQVGEGVIGQVVSTGYPSLITNVGSSHLQRDVTSYHTPVHQLASLLVLPLRTRREILGALVIAANDPGRAMSDEALPLAEVLAERAALAIENSKLYTEQVEARRKVEDLSRLKDEFLSIASHELRTPVTSIKGYTQLAKTLIRENDLPTSEEYLDIALDQIDRMSRLILELLDVSRIETGRLEIRREPIVWATFVRDVVHRHHTAVSDRRFHLNVPDDTKLVNGDRDRLEQVLGNLLENAVKYSPDGSDVFVSVEDRGDSMITSVCDRGIGIPADELAQVFERFHRGRHVSSTNYGGLGLGLYITKQIVERHSGAIWVESKEGSGTTFFFSLPAEQVVTNATSPPQLASHT